METEKKPKKKKKKPPRVYRYVRISALEVVSLAEWAKRNGVHDTSARNRFMALFRDRSIITAFEASRLKAKRKMPKLGKKVKPKPKPKKKYTYAKKAW